MKKYILAATMVAFGATALVGEEPTVTSETKTIIFKGLSEKPSDVLLNKYKKTALAINKNLETWKVNQKVNQNVLNDLNVFLENLKRILDLKNAKDFLNNLKEQGLKASLIVSVIEKLIKQEDTDLINAIKNQKLAKFNEWLVKQKNPQLLIAVAEKDINVDRVNKLLKEGADANARAKSGYTALMLAALKGNEDKVQALLDAGADKTATTRTGKTAAEIAKEEGHDEIADMLSTN